MIEIQRTGSHMMIVDAGRFGYRQYGVPSSGSMDRISAARANSLLSNPLSCALLEMYLSGHQIKFHCQTQIVLCGAQAEMHVDEVRIYSGEVVHILPGSILSIGAIQRGSRIYLAVKGGIESSVILDSRSGIPGYFQRNLFKGDKLNFRTSNKKKNSSAMIKALDIQVTKTIICHPGPEWHVLTKANQKKIQQTIYSISNSSDRMGLRLEGNTVYAKKTEILSSAVIPGTIQLLPSGLPIILMRDCQTTGGYPRILQLQEEDINQLAQRRPGQEVQVSVLSL